MSKPVERGLWWVKRDFRIRDNDALNYAIEQCETVTALFVVEPSLCRASESSLFHYNAWRQAADHLAQQLHAIGGHLLVVQGEVVEVLERIRNQDGFDAIFSHQETGSSITYERDKCVQQWAHRHDIPWHELHQNGVIRALKSRDTRQPIIKQRLMNTTPAPAPTQMRSWVVKALSNDSAVCSDSQATDSVAPQMERLSASAADRGVKPSIKWPEFETLSGRDKDHRIDLTITQTIDEQHAEALWRSFLYERGLQYSGGISSPNTAFHAGSRLSAHLAWGTISLRRVFHELWQREKELKGANDPSSIRWRKSLKAFQSRLHWHDHFIQRLESAPHMEFEALNPAYQQVTYGDNDALLHAWEYGKTGLPIVDACMRCLATTGFLNFRMRAMVVSTGCFGLAQSWHSLHAPLARVFLDYEPGIHFSQIQMQAGIVGINTLRIYSPHKQLLEQDAQATFVKRWIPELREFDATQIANYEHQVLGDYPEPVTDTKANTQRIRDQIYKIRKSKDGQAASEEVLVKHGSRLPGNDRNRKRKSPRSGPTNSSRSKATAASKQMQLDFDS